MKKRYKCSKRFFRCGHYPDYKPYLDGCGNMASVKRGMKWYCLIHDPVLVNAKEMEKQAKNLSKLAKKFGDLNKVVSLVIGKA